MRTYAVVMPVFEDQESFAELCRRLKEIETQASLSLRIVAVDDGSLRAPPKASSISDAGLQGEVLRLARNVGHQTAIAVGLAYVSSLPGLDGCVIMDSDGEDKPEALPVLIELIRSPDHDVAVAERAKRQESLVFRTFYSIYRRFFKLLTGQQLRFGNFMALTPRAVDRLAGMHETSTHIAAAVVKARLRRLDARIDRGTRYAGRSSMSFSSLVLHGMRAVMVFSELVLTRMALMLIALAGLVSFALVGAIAAKIMGMATPGWLTTVTGFALSLFLQAGLVAMITLIVSSLGQIDTPPRVKTRALEFIREIERVNSPVPAE